MTMMDRRAFLARLGFGTVAAAAAANGLLDVERLLWTPGEKTIFVPPPSSIAPLGTTFTVGDVFTIEGVYPKHPLTGKTLPFLQQFVITADVSAGETLQVERVWPMPRDRGAYRNVSKSPVRAGLIDGSRVRPVSCGVSAPIQSAKIATGIDPWYADIKADV